MTKNIPFFPILHVFAPLNDVRAYIAWSWKTTLIMWFFFTRMISNFKYKWPPWAKTTCIHGSHWSLRPSIRHLWHHIVIQLQISAPQKTIYTHINMTRLNTESFYKVLSVIIPSISHPNKCHHNKRKPKQERTQWKHDLHLMWPHPLCFSQVVAFIKLEDVFH